MSRAFADISFTPSVKAAQSLYGSRDANMGFELTEDPRHTLTEPEMALYAASGQFWKKTVYSKHSTNHSFCQLSGIGPCLC